MPGVSYGETAILSIALRCSRTRRPLFSEFKKVPPWTSWDSPSVPDVEADARFRTLVNEVTPPNLCRAHATSSSSVVGKSCLWMPGG